MRILKREYIQEVNMEYVYKFLKDVGTYYLATVEGEQPRVRPFASVNAFEGKLYIYTRRNKKVIKF